MTGLKLETPKPDQGTDSEMLVDIHSACMDDVHPRPSINGSAVSDEESAALDVWLPWSGSPISPKPMSNLKSSWWPNQDLGLCIGRAFHRTGSRSRFATNL